MNSLLFDIIKIYYILIISLLIFLLISNAVSVRRDKSILFSRIVIKTLIFSSIIAINNLYISPLEKGIGIYGGLFNVSTLTQSFNIFILLISGVILILTGFYPRKINVKNISSIYKLLSFRLVYNKSLISNKTGEQFRIIEYALIISFILCGAVFLVSTGDLISLFLSIELQSYGLYILSTLYRDSESATASGLTYFLLGGLSSCFILLGSAILYANSGTTNLDNIYIIYFLAERSVWWYDPLFIDLSLIILSAGLLFKVSAAPFHFWSPDVYDGVPTIVTTYIAIIPKISIFALFIDLFSHIIGHINSWTTIFLMSTIFSFIIGSVLGLTQSRIKRLFAYSTISHVGFILLGLCTAPGKELTTNFNEGSGIESMQACIFYIFQYTIANLNAFFILLSIGYIFYIYVNKEKNEVRDKLVDENNSPIQLISQIKGYFYINAFLSISFAITIFSFVGIPPTAGFFAKQMILSGALDKKQVSMTLIAVLTSVIGAVYYLNLIKQIFFFKCDYDKNASINKNLIGYIVPNDSINSDNVYNRKEMTSFEPDNLTINSGLSSTISIITLLLLLFIYIPEEWFNIVGVLTLTLYN